MVKTYQTIDPMATVTVASLGDSESMRASPPQRAELHHPKIPKLLLHYLNHNFMPCTSAMCLIMEHTADRPAVVLLAWQADE